MGLPGGLHSPVRVKGFLETQTCYSRPGQQWQTVCAGRLLCPHPQLLDGSRYREASVSCQAPCPCTTLSGQEDPDLKKLPRQWNTEDQQ